MKILHRYIIKELARNLLVTQLVFLFLFLIVDFFDRINNIIGEDASLTTVMAYFALKMPVMISITLPIAVLVAVLFTIGILSKNSEVTAMRASGLTLLWITRPIIVFGLVLSVAAMIFNETLVPLCARRVQEIYDFDIKKQDEKGSYSQSDFWWRSSDKFYSVKNFDSRTNRLFGLLQIELNPEMEVARRTDAIEAKWLEADLGWSMQQVKESQFFPKKAPEITFYKSLPLPIKEEPKDFYDVKADPQTMSIFSLRRFIKDQRRNGVAVSDYLADYYAKVSSPFIILLITLLVTPFAMRPGRNTSMAASFLGGLAIGFSYYAVHSLSLALGRAEIWSPLMSAWAANAVMLAVALILHLGAESPA